MPEPERAILMRLRDADLPIEQRKQALVRLFGAESVVARGLALDYYSVVQANLRHGPEPMIDDAIDDAARACALRELQAPPHERTEVDAQPRRGANHASALHALWHNAATEDAPLLARVLEENRNEEAVLSEGVKLAQAVLYREPVAHAGLVDVLVELARRPDLDPGIRADAIRAVGAASDEAVIPPILDAVRDPELAVSAAGVRVLLERNLARYRPLVESIAAAWQTGELSPFDVHEVRRLLEEEPSADGP